jgi:hypothetical protein
MQALVSDAWEGDIRLERASHRAPSAYVERLVVTSPEKLPRLPADVENPAPPRSRGAVPPVGEGSVSRVEQGRQDLAGVALGPIVVSSFPFGKHGPTMRKSLRQLVANRIADVAVIPALPQEHRDLDRAEFDAPRCDDQFEFT